MPNWTGKVTVYRAYMEPAKHRFNVQAPSKLRAELAVDKFYRAKYSRHWSDDEVSLTFKFDDNIDADGDARE